MACADAPGAEAMRWRGQERDSSGVDPHVMRTQVAVSTSSASRGRLPWTKAQGRNTTHTQKDTAMSKHANGHVTLLPLCQPMPSCERERRSFCLA